MDASTSNRTRAIAQVHQPNSTKPQKQKHRHHSQRKDDCTPASPTICTNGCRYYYDSTLPPSFPDLTPPIDMPQPTTQTTSTTAQQLKTTPCRKMPPQFPDDPDTIEFCLDEEPAAAQKYYKDSNTSSRSRHKNYEPHVRWSRNNIAVTMERFQPIASPSSASESSSCASSSHQDYSYAYYEPGAIMCHSNIPTPEDVAGPSVLPPPNSMRALLLKTKEKSHKTLPANRHTYTTRYGTHENIYEDVSNEKNTRLASSEQSLSERGCTKKEFQHILNNHYRVLEELNLSVEELLMSTTPPQNEPSPLITRTTVVTINDNSNNNVINGAGSGTTISGVAVGIGSGTASSSSSSSTTDTLSNQFTSLDIKDDTRSPISEIIIGEDSGFSGSSSGASYIGSLRNYKTAITRSLRRSSAPNCTASNNKTLYGSCRTAKFPHEIRHGSFYNGNNNINNNNNNNNNNINNINNINNNNNNMMTTNAITKLKPDDMQKGVKFSLWNNKRS